MTDVKLEKLEHDIGQIKREIVGIKRMVVTMVKEPIVIEQLTEEKLSQKERKSMNKSLEDLRKGRKEKFVTLDVLRKASS